MAPDTTETWPNDWDDLRPKRPKGGVSLLHIIWTVFFSRL